MALILCIEAGTNVGSVALAENGDVVALKSSTGDRDHARNLAVFVDEIFKARGITAKDLSAVAVGKGPGSYTGLRIAISLAKGLCYGASIPLIAVSSLEAMVHTALETIPDTLAGKRPLMLPMIDARRMEVYCQLFNVDAEPVGEIEAHILDESSFINERRSDGLIIFGSGAEKSKTIFKEEENIYLDVEPSAAGLVKPAWEAYKSGRFEDVSYFEPFYLKDFVVTASLKKIF